MKKLINDSIEKEYPIILTAKDVSEILKISKPTAYELMNQKDFPLIKIGRCKRVLKDDFLEWLANEAQNK